MSDVQIDRDRLHGKADLGQSAVVYSNKRRRIDVDTDDVIFHLKVIETHRQGHTVTSLLCISQLINLLANVNDNKSEKECIYTSASPLLFSISMPCFCTRHSPAATIRISDLLSRHFLILTFSFFSFNPQDLYYRGYKKTNNNNHNHNRTMFMLLSS